MFFYLVMAILVAVLVELSVKVRLKPLRIITGALSILIPTFFYSVRYGIGTDYNNYLSIFEDIKRGLDSRMEWGYELVNKVIAHLGGSVELVFFVVGFIMILFVYLSLKDYKNVLSPGLGMFVFMLLYYQMSFNAVRQLIAVAIILYSIKYIRDRKLLKFTFFIFLASGFHMSSLAVFPVYFMYEIIGKQQKMFRKVIFYVLAFLIVISLDVILIPIFSSLENLEYYVRYLTNESTSGTDIGFLIRQLPFIIITMYLYKYIDKYDKNFNLYFSIYIMSIILGFTRLIGADYISRISINFEIVLVLLLPYLVRFLNNRREFVVSWLLICYIVIHWWYIYIYIGSNGTFPYEWIFNR